MLSKKNIFWIFYLVCLSIGLSQAEDEDKTKFREVEDPNKSNKIQASTKPSVESRFFDLGGVINQLFPGFNQGGAAGGNPGLNLPSNSQFYPGGPAQSNNPLTPINQGNGWYPNQQNVERPTFQNQMLPSESNFNQRGSINNINQPRQYLNQGGVGQYPADLNGNLINGNQFWQGGNPQYSNAQQGQPQLGVNQGQGLSNFDSNNSFLNQNGQFTSPNWNQGGNLPSSNGQFLGNGFNNLQGQTLSPGQFSNGQNQGLPQDQNIGKQNANGAQLKENLGQLGFPGSQYSINPRDERVVNSGQTNVNNQNRPGQWNQNLPGNNDRIHLNQGQHLGLQNQYPNEQNLGNGFNNPANSRTGLNQGLQGLNNMGQSIKKPSQINTHVGFPSWPAPENRPEDGQLPSYALSQGQPPLSSDDSWSNSPSGSNKKPLYTGQGNSNNRGPQTNVNGQNWPGQWNQNHPENNNRIPSKQGQDLGPQNQYPNEQNLGNGFNNPANEGTGLNQGLQGTGLNNTGQQIKKPSQLNTQVGDASWPSSENRPENSQISNYSLSQGRPPLSSDDSWNNSPSGSNKKPLYTGQGNYNNRGQQNGIANRGTNNDFLNTSDAHLNPGHGNDGFVGAISFPEVDDDDDDEDDDEEEDDVDEMYKKAKRQSTMTTPSTPLIRSILGKPVLIPTSTVSSDQLFFTKSDIITATQKQCVQNCPTSTEYKPVCGTDNVSYFNAERLVCARNCGIKVFEASDGSCRINN